MNFLNSELSPDFMQADNTPKITKLNTFISFDKDKLPTKLINNNLNNKFITNNTVINARENQIKLNNNDDKNNNNLNPTSNKNINFPSVETESKIDFNNLFKNINEEKNKLDKPLQVNNCTSSLTEVLFNKPAPLHFTKTKHLSKSCTRLEIQNIKDKLNENLEIDNKISDKCLSAWAPASNAINFDNRREKSFDAYSNSDSELRNLNRKMHLEDELDEIEKEAYGFSKDINRNFKGDMKFNLDEIDIFLDNENGIRNKNNYISIGKNQGDKNNGNNANIDEKIDKEMKLIKKMSAEMRRLDTLSTSDIQDKDGPGFFAEADLLREINKIKSQYLLHKLVFDEDVVGVSKLLRRFANYPEQVKEIVNQKDIRDNTPLMLCILKRLSCRTTEILQIMIELLSNYAENSRNSDKQSVFEIAQSNEDLEAVCLMYDFILERRNKKIIRNKERAKNFLAKTQNFYLEMKWELNVKVPLVSYFCPNDVCKIWKFDQNVRMDYSFVEFKNLSSVRCPSSWYFLGGFGKIANTSKSANESQGIVKLPLKGLYSTNDRLLGYDKNNNLNNKNNFMNFNNNNNTSNNIKTFKNEEEQSNQGSNIFQANLKANTYFNPFEEFEESEKQLIIKDIMNSHRIHGEFKLKDCIITESLGGWGKKPVIEKINGWNAKKYEVSLTAFVNLHNKEKFFYKEFNKKDYFDAEKPLHKQIVFVENKEDTKKNIADGFKVKNDKMRSALIKISDNKDKKLKAHVWIAENFPIKSSSLIAVIDSVSSANEFTKKIKEFLKDKEVKKIIDNNGFPIKITIPINFLIDVTVKFTKFMDLKNRSEVENLFTIPPNVKRISRKEAQKLDVNQKKRIAYANIQ